MDGQTSPSGQHLAADAFYRRTVMYSNGSGWLPELV